MSEPVQARARPRLAVLFVHGIAAGDEDFAATASALLRREFARAGGVRAADALVIRTAFWAPAYSERQDELLRRLGGDAATGVFALLDRLAAAAARGSVPALLLAAATLPIRWLPGMGGSHYPALRWLVTHYLGDAVAYQGGPSDADWTVRPSGRGRYDGVHRIVARALHELADEAGGDAPLCVLGHSLGTVVTSNFFRDLQLGSERLAPQVAAELGATPLERGETLTWFYSLGSPLALWAQREPDFGRPISVPAPALAEHHPNIEGGWVNVWDPDDVFASPLRGLNEHWRAGVAEDRRVSVRPWWLGWTPAAHIFYWNDSAVLRPIANTLARAWQRLCAG